MVIVEVPGAVAEPTVTVIVEVPAPGAAIEVGLKATVTPEGWPEADSATALVKPFETAVVIVEVPEPPCASDPELGEAESGKSGGGVLSCIAAVQIHSWAPRWVGGEKKPRLLQGEEALVPGPPPLVQPASPERSSQAA